MTHLSSTAQSNSPGSWVEIWYGDDRIGPPTPLITFGQDIRRDAAEDRILVVNTITLEGTYLDTPNGTYNDMWSGQEILRDIFSSDGKQFSLRAGPANTVIAPGEYIASGIYPRVTSLSIPSDIQVTQFKYSVTLEYDDTSGANSGLIDSVENNWAWAEQADDLTVEVTHNVRVKGRNTATSGTTNNSYVNAQSYASALLGIDNAPTGFPYHVQKTGATNTWYEVSTDRVESVDINGGTYAATERLVIASGVYPWSNQRRINFNTDLAQITTADIQGTIQGFGRTNIGVSGSLGFDNATSGWLNHVKPALYADITKYYTDVGLTNTLNTDPESLSVALLEFPGRVEYSAQYTDAPSNSLPSGIAERKVTYNRQDPIQMIAWHQIPFRALGDVKQEMGTTTPGTISITAMARATHTGDLTTDVNRAIAQVESDVNAIRPDPNTSEFDELELSGEPQMSYDPKTLTANASVNWKFTMDLAGVNSASGNISFQRYAGGL